VTFLLLLAVLLGLLPAFIASRKGHSFFFWWIFGALLFIVALPLALIARDVRIKCPYCVEPVSKQATVCPHCHSQLPQWVGTHWWRVNDAGAKEFYESGVGWRAFEEA